MNPFRNLLPLTVIFFLVAGSCVKEDIVPPGGEGNLSSLPSGTYIGESETGEEGTPSASLAVASCLAGSEDVEDLSSGIPEEAEIVSPQAVEPSRGFTFIEPGNVFKAVPARTISQERDDMVKKPASVVPVKEVFLEFEILDINIGSSTVVGVKYLPSDATVKSVKWDCSDPSVLEVGNNGWIKGLRAGEVKLAVFADGISASCLVRVKDIQGFNIVEGYDK